MVQVAGKGEDLGRRRSLCRRRGLRADGSASVQSGPAVTGPRPLPREQRVAAIRDALQATFAPTVLEVRDDSHRHAGHAGARDGRGHFDVRIVSEAFAGMAPLARPRAVYAAMGELMPTDIDWTSTRLNSI